MVSAIYRKRALPIASIAVQGNKRHYPEEIHSGVWCLLSEAATKQATICRLLWMLWQFARVTYAQLR